jgi:hypothetical protein
MCAGTTPGSRTVGPSGLDHPRVRGDDAKRIEESVDLIGPPPRTRGRHYAQRRHRPARRITPSARGRQLETRREAFTPWTTPAGAGTTWSPSTTRSTRRDHSRVRGNEVGMGIELIPHLGLPSRARGRPGVRVGHLAVRRTIPACAGRPAADHWQHVGGGATPAGAGTTTERCHRRCSRRDHPRGCGEDDQRARWRSTRSSDHPACAGTTIC